VVPFSLLETTFRATKDKTKRGEERTEEEEEEKEKCLAPVNRENGTRQ